MTLVSFTESFVFFVPPDALLIPMTLADRDRAWRNAAICTLASVAGAAVGYGIGLFAYETVGGPVLEFYGYEEQFEAFASDFNQYGAWAVLIAGFTPFPFKAVTVLSGATGLSIPVFLISCVIARGARFFLVVAILRQFGPAAAAFVEKRFGIVAGLVVAAAVAIVIALAFLP